MILIYITCQNQDEAEKISEKLLEKQLIICSNMFPVNSIYRWKSKIHREKEVVILAKSVDKNFTKIQKEVKRMHSFEVPEILAIKIEKANSEYLNWLRKEIK